MFNGFTDKTVEFMWGIRFNNEKAWFEANKETYLSEFYGPMRELGEELFAWFTEQRPDLPLRSRISRIYRDARRLHGRGPYKESLWISVEAPAESVWTSQPTFWFELMPESWTYGLGYYSATPATMRKLRARMERDPKTMETLTRKLNRQKEFALEGERYKKPKDGAPSRLLEPWYAIKGFSLIHTEKLSETLFSRELVTQLKAGYKFLLPYYDYFVTLDGDPDPAE